MGKVKKGTVTPRSFKNYQNQGWKDIRIFPSRYCAICDNRLFIIIDLHHRVFPLTTSAIWNSDAVRFTDIFRRASKRGRTSGVGKSAFSLSWSLIRPGWWTPCTGLGGVDLSSEQQICAAQASSINNQNIATNSIEEKIYPSSNIVYWEKFFLWFEEAHKLNTSIDQKTWRK